MKISDLPCLGLQNNLKNLKEDRIIYKPVSIQFKFCRHQLRNKMLKNRFLKLCNEYKKWNFNFKHAKISKINFKFQSHILKISLFRTTKMLKTMIQYRLIISISYMNSIWLLSKNYKNWKRKCFVDFQKLWNKWTLISTKIIFRDANSNCLSLLNLKSRWINQRYNRLYHLTLINRSWR